MTATAERERPRVPDWAVRLLLVVLFGVGFVGVMPLLGAWVANAALHAHEPVPASYVRLFAAVAVPAGVMWIAVWMWLRRRQARAHDGEVARTAAPARVWLLRALMLSGGVLSLAAAPLLGIGMAAELGLTEDPDPNPVGAGVIYVMIGFPGLCVLLGSWSLLRRERS